MPQRFSIEYVDRDNTRRQPFMVHRALLGSLERFFGVLIEHHAGAFPGLGCAGAGDCAAAHRRHVPYSRSVAQTLAAAGVRVEVDERNEKLGYKIREAQLAKIAYMLVVGKREVEQGGVAVRKRDGQDLGFMPQNEVLEMLKKGSSVSPAPHC